MSNRSIPIFVAGEWLYTPITEPNINPTNGTVLDEVCQADDSVIEKAVGAAVQAFERMRTQPAHVRIKTCRQIAELLRKRGDDLAEIIALESGKPIRFARGEAERASYTFDLAAEQAGICGENTSVAIDRYPTGTGKPGFVKRFPVGPVLAMSPFNFPLNLTAHKLGPAFATGCPVVLKPSPHTPQTNLMLAKICEDAGIIDGALSVIPCSNELAESMVRDERFKLVSFTGSARVGWHLKNICGSKRVVLELGNNSANIVHDDVKDLDATVDRLCVGAFAAAGQICIKVQRLFVHRAIFEEFARRFVEKTRMLRTGDPLKNETIVGPMIDDASVLRVMEWIQTATQNGARVLTGGRRNGNFIEPTVLCDVPADDRCMQEEIFGPVVVLEAYDDFETVLHVVNDTPYGLQAALFTQDVSRIFRAFDVLDVGALIVNDYSTFRVDNMPYGGTKRSGFGREGLYESILEYTEPKLLVLTLP